MGSKHRMECGATPTMHVGLDPKVNLIRDGMASQRCAREIVHPVQGLQQNFLRMKMDRKAAEMGQLYGSHMMMRRKMEEAILSRHQRLLGLKSHLVGLSTLVNMDEEFGFEDVLDGPCMMRWRSSYLGGHCRSAHNQLVKIMELDALL